MAIDNFCVEIDQATHEAIHGGGDWRLARKEWEGEWNRMTQSRVLEEERRAGRKLVFEEVKEVGLALLKKYDLPTDFVPYRRKR